MGIFRSMKHRPMIHKTRFRINIEWDTERTGDSFPAVEVSLCHSWFQNHPVPRIISIHKLLLTMLHWLEPIEFDRNEIKWIERWVSSMSMDGCQLLTRLVAYTDVCNASRVVFVLSRIWATDRHECKRLDNLTCFWLYLSCFNQSSKIF